MKNPLLLLLLLTASLRLLCAPPSEIPLQASTALPQNFPAVSFTPAPGAFPLVASGSVADIVTDQRDFPVVGIAAGLLADDVERISGRRPTLSHARPRGPAVVAGTLGKSRLVDQLVRRLGLDVSAVRGRWESFIVASTLHPDTQAPLLLLVGSDRRGTAFALTSLSEAIGVSPFYWWADVEPTRRSSVFVAPGTYVQGEPSVQYRGIFINDERFGGWARWAEQRHGQVGPVTYEKVFELLLRLRANYLWPAMHPGTQPFNADPANAQLADRYAIVMGSSHCEQMLRNNEGEWKAVNQQAEARGAKGLGDFNYITNRRTMLDYWETRVRTNGRYENTYTLGLRGIHDYPMEGARTTEERVRLMQQAIDDQRDMLRRNIRLPLPFQRGAQSATADIPQVLCTYEEVLDAYHHGLQVPEDVTLLCSDDKHGYCRNLCNPDERRRRGGAGIYYHLSYHGDPASWIWLSPLSPSFLSTELSKAYAFGARKIWVFNVGDIKPAEKELAFVMELAWNVSRWQPADAHRFTEYWAARTFGADVAPLVADLLKRYYRLQAGGKDAHVWFVDYSEPEVSRRLSESRSLELEAEQLARRIPPHLQDAYFELVSYPVRGAALLNEYQLLARRSLVCAARGDSLSAMADASRVTAVFDQLNGWTRRFNEDVRQGKWREFFNWQPYHWYRSERIDPPVATPALIDSARLFPQPRFLPVADALSPDGVVVEAGQACDVPLWIEALTPVRDFSKSPVCNEFCLVTTDAGSFRASATPINNIWHATSVGPMWSCAGKLHFHRGRNLVRLSDLHPDARIDRIFLGLYPPFAREPRLRIPASAAGHLVDGTCSLNSAADAPRMTRVQGLGYTDGLVALPFDTPSYGWPDASSASAPGARQLPLSDAPYAEFELSLEPADSLLEVRTLPTLHVYEGRDARFAVQLGDHAPLVFSIHADDFSAEWRHNVLRGFAARRVALPADLRRRLPCRLPCRVYLLDPGIVLQELLVY